MSSKLKEFSRRGFLRGAGKLILPLPILNCMLNTNGTAYAQGAGIQPFFMYALNGLSTGSNSRPGARLLNNGRGYQPFQNRAPNCYYPLQFGNISGGNIALPFSMSPLNNFKNDFNVITNLEITRGGNAQGAVSTAGENVPHHSVGLYVLLSGDGKYYTGSTNTITTTSGERIRRTNSNVASHMTTPDHYIYDQLGRNGRMFSLHVEKERHGSGAKHEISWKNGVEETPQRDLVRIYNSLFSSLDTGSDKTDTQKNAEKLKKEGILSLIKTDYDAVKKLVGREDKITLESHMSKIEVLEKEIRSISSVTIGGACQQPSRPSLNDSVRNNYGNEIERAKILNSMIAMAASCRVSQVMTYGITNSRSGIRPGAFSGFVKNPNYARTQKTPDAHSLTHDGTAEAVQAYEEFHMWQVSVYADLINKFKQIKIGNDSLLDYSNLVYVIEAGYGKSFENGSAWHAHSLENMVMMNAGGKKLGVQLGNHINGKKKHPMSVINSVQRAMKISNPKVGEVTSTIDEIA